jgi:hypothetical protein
LTPSLKELRDTPDIYCVDQDGQSLYLEITLTEDQDGDIKALLGRSKHKSLEYVKVHGMGRGSSLNGNVLSKVQQAIEKKLNRNYGSGVALVVRDVSPIGWNWDSAMGSLRELLEGVKSPFDKGIWIINSSEDIFQVL